VSKFAAGVDNGGKFATSVIDTGGARSLANLSMNFFEKFEITLILFPGAWGKVIHEKNLNQNLVTLSL
jgi:hypothetical protein